MKVVALEMDLAWHDVRANIATVDAAMDWVREQAPDLVVLPEMWASGFTMQPEAIAPEDQRLALQAMQRWSKTTDAAWYGSLVWTLADGTHRNRGLFVTPEQNVMHYDKRHLFTFAGEHRHFSGGDERVVVQWRGWRILLQICYDLRFPVFSRNRDTDADGWDLALYVANWPAVRGDAWSTLLRARAIENCGWVCGVNRTGQDGNDVQYDGRSALIDPKGTAHPADAENPRNPGIRMAKLELSMDELSAYRRKFPALADGDAFTLHAISGATNRATMS